MDGFAEVPRIDIFSGIQVGNRPSDLQDTAVGACGEAQAGDGVLQEFLAIGRDCAMLANHLGHHLGVGVGLFFCAEAVELPIARRYYALADRR